MTPAEFKTAHEALGVSTAFLAERIGVSSGMVWKYESTARTAEVPDHAEDVMRGLLNDWEAASDRLTAEVRDAEDGVIVRSVDLGEFYMRVPELRGWGALAQGLLLADVQRRCQAPIEFSTVTE